MYEFVVKVPAELESEFKSIPQSELSMMVNRLLHEKLSRVARVRRIVSKSKASQEQVDELSGDIKKSMWARYERLLGQE